MNRETFFAYVRNAPFGGSLLTPQVDGMTAILDQWELSGASDDRWLAYMLATTFHETGTYMLPIKETVMPYQTNKNPSDATVIARLDAAYKKGTLKVSKPYWRKDANGLAWFGRGLVQITHRVNYDKFGLGKNPSVALDMPVAIRILFDGMVKGMFTGLRLSDFFNATTDDPIGARKIVNGTDKAKLIAGYHKNFLDAITAAKKVIQPADVTPGAARPDDVPPAQSKSLWAILLAIFTGGGASVVKSVTDNGASLLGAIDNPWAALSLVSLGGGGLLVWLILSGRLQVLRGKASQ